LGWGRYAGDATFRNPLAEIFPSFSNRASSYAQAGGGNAPGSGLFSSFFHGANVGVFGGAVWHTPLDGLALMVEYDSDNYSLERANGNFSPRSQVNYGLAYDLSDATQVGLDWLYGTSLGGSVSLRLDPVHAQYPQKIEPPAPSVVVRTPEQQQAALAALEDLRDPHNARRTQAFQSRNADRNGFVDALWQEGGDYSDIQLNRNTLDLTVTGPVSNARCAATARLMQGVAVQIDQVRLRDTDGRRSISCAVPRSIEGQLVSAAPQRSPDGGAAHVERILPDGCIDLMLVDGALVVAGPDTISVPLTK